MSGERRPAAGGGGALRILVVEDHPLNLTLVRDLLELRGHAVVGAGDVAGARAALRGGAFDLVVMDVQVPGGGGELLVRELRGRPEAAGLPVVAVTAFAMSGDRERLLAAGFDGYLSKPIDTRTFAREIEALWAARRGVDG